MNGQNLKDDNIYQGADLRFLKLVNNSRALHNIVEI